MVTSNNSRSNLIREEESPLTAAEHDRNKQECRLFLGLMRATNLEVNELQCKRCHHDNSDCTCQDDDKQYVEVEFTIPRDIFARLDEFYNSPSESQGEMGIISESDQLIIVKITALSKLSYIAGSLIDRQICTWMARSFQELLYVENTYEAQQLSEELRIDWHLERMRLIDEEIRLERIH